MTLAATVKLETEANVQYLSMLVCGETLHNFELLSADVENKNTSLDVDYLLKDLAWCISIKP